MNNFEKQLETIEYCSELRGNFYGYWHSVTGYRQSSFDTLRNIDFYRKYVFVSDLIEAYPSMEPQEAFLDILWRYFDEFTSVEIAELAIDMIHEVTKDDE